MEIDGKKVVCYKPNPDQIKEITYPGVNNKNGRYLITYLGDIIDLNPQITNPKTGAVKGRPHVKSQRLDKDGYYRVNLDPDTDYRSSGNFITSRLVGWEFVPENRSLDMTIEHIDCNKKNNYYANLSWVTSPENTRLAYENKIRANDIYRSDEEIDRLCKILQDNIDLTYEQSCAKAGIKNITYEQSTKLCTNILKGIAWKHISYKYDFTNKINNQRITFTDELKENLIIRYKNGESFDSIYDSLYKNSRFDNERNKSVFLTKFKVWINEYNLNNNESIIPRISNERVIFTPEINNEILQKYKNGESMSDIYQWIYNEEYDKTTDKCIKFKKRFNTILNSYYYIILPDGYKIPIVERINKNKY